MKNLKLFSEFLNEAAAQTPPQSEIEKYRFIKNLKAGMTIPSNVLGYLSGSSWAKTLEDEEKTIWGLVKVFDDMEGSEYYGYTDRELKLLAIVDISNWNTEGPPSPLKIVRIKEWNGRSDNPQDTPSFSRDNGWDDKQPLDPITEKYRFIKNLKEGMEISIIDLSELEEKEVWTHVKDLYPDRGYTDEEKKLIAVVRPKEPIKILRIENWDGKSDF